MLDHWSADPVSGAQHRLALVGVIGFFVALAPLLEFGVRRGRNPGGMTAFAPVAVVFLAWLARRASAVRPAIEAASASAS